MTSLAKLTTFLGQEADATVTISPYMTRLTLNGKTRYSCNFCKVNFLNITCCIRHIRIHTGEKPFSCSYCNQSFSRKYAAEIHERVHTGEKPFSCSYCNQTFARQYTAQAHENLHTGEKPYHCKVCRLSFPSHSHLNYHRKQKANIACSVSRSKGSRPNLSSTTTSNLNVRSVQRRQIATKNNTDTLETETMTVKPVNVQTGDRPYTCKYSYCKKAFALKNNAKTHEKTHLGVNSFHCNVCSKGFRSNRGLKYHLTESKRSKCSTGVIRGDAAAVQITKPTLPIKSTKSKIKKRTQEGQDQCVSRRKPSTYPKLKRQKVGGNVFHCCIYCKKKFKRRKSALEHIKIHIGGQRFSCTYSKCNKSYSREGDLRRHQKTHSG